MAKDKTKEQDIAPDTEQVKTAEEYEAEIAALKLQLLEKEKLGDGGPYDPIRLRGTPVSNEGEELVTIELFKDDGKYKDPLLVCVNGESLLIQRGVPVQIKKKFLWAIEQSRIQDRDTARLISEESEAFKRKQREHHDA